MKSDEILRSTGGTGDIDRGPVQQVHERGTNRRRVQDQGWGLDRDVDCRQIYSI